MYDSFSKINPHFFPEEMGQLMVLIFVIQGQIPSVYFTLMVLSEVQYVTLLRSHVGLSGPWIFKLEICLVLICGEN